MPKAWTAGPEVLKYCQNAEKKVREHEKEKLGARGRLMGSSSPVSPLHDLPCLRIVISQCM